MDLIREKWSFEDWKMFSLWDWSPLNIPVDLHPAHLPLLFLMYFLFLFFVDKVNSVGHLIVLEVPRDPHYKEESKGAGDIHCSVMHQMVIGRRKVLRLRTVRPYCL